MSKPRIAIVHDYLREYGGAERVLEALHKLYPQAPVYTAFIDQKAMGRHWQNFADWDLRTTWLAKVPFVNKLFSPLRVLAPAAFASLELSDFDVVISSSNAYYAKAVSVPNGVHICYCHTPPRSLYGYSTMSDWKKNPVTKIGGELINHYLRIKDFQIAQNVDIFIANSVETQRRIAKFYRRKSEVIYPPVQLPKVTVAKTKEPYFLYVNRLAFAKHPDLAVAACAQLNIPLKVAGDGPMLLELKKMAGPKTEFLGAVGDIQLAELYAGATALVYPVEDEDFGIVPIEAMMAGKPVIAHYSGGPTQTLQGPNVDDTKLDWSKHDPLTAVFFNNLSVEGLRKAIKVFMEHKTSFKSDQIANYAAQFGAKEFNKKIEKLSSRAHKSLKIPVNK